MHSRTALRGFGVSCDALCDRLECSLRGWDDTKVQMLCVVWLHTLFMIDAYFVTIDVAVPLVFTIRCIAVH